MTDSGAPASPAAAAGPAGRRQPAAADHEIPYEQARDELMGVVRRLEAGGLTLEQSLELWERGERLADICSGWLEGARARLAAVMSARAGDAGGAGEGGEGGGAGEAGRNGPAPF